MTQSGEGNGCENGKRSHRNGGLHHFLYFHACGSHSAIQGDVQGKVLFWPVLAPGPPSGTVPRAAFCILVLSNCAPWGVHPALQHPNRPAANAPEMLLETQEILLWLDFQSALFMSLALCRHVYIPAHILWDKVCSTPQLTCKGLYLGPQIVLLCFPISLLSVLHMYTVASLAEAVRGL
ncbi:hypothetical protein mRhiFer1_008683 [Rhinolophus ferrumequinum]|uniref:Uncharacterized protein n=1 Tax=Rhinolophus ferrumequinum TaxID=59479 RepID=A0A7J7TQ68_RHIFE|nr:hypothetical protein mRhiFer1_008683 [Rhinolophus ferrumequinum]